MRRVKQRRVLILTDEPWGLLFGYEMVPKEVKVLRNAIRSWIDKSAEDLWRIAYQIHSFKEVKFQEYRSSAILADWLESHGFSVNRGLAGLDTAFVAECSVGSGGPVLAFVAEYDALPKIGHACGHNLIATMSTGAGVALARWMAESHRSGRVMVVGSPGEEGGGGKIALLESGVFKSVDIAMMLHPAALDEVNPHYLAREGLDFHFYGRAAHAASGPQFGINALDAVVTFYQLLNALRPRLLAMDRVHGIITHGGDAPNVIPEHTSARILVRSDTVERVRELLELVIQAADAAARGVGCTFEWDRFVPMYKNIINDPRLVDLAYQAFEAFGRTPVIDSQLHGSTDMGNVSYEVPALHANIGLGEGLVGHTHEFCEASNSPRGRQTMEDGAGILAMIGASYLVQYPESNRPIP
ncbi:MAG: amidohydrolase [Sulfobacillus acidophilus]|uniref:Peptidase M20 domain-containing protein 2 n=1 Tax=Sulfobacillus acidophilus TaxID=53633 RepID=A0A2T2WH10_9FIRM|nr:MAG: amidohydrolase [Sulfobacillus acidophilus]